MDKSCEALSDLLLDSFLLVVRATVPEAVVKIFEELNAAKAAKAAINALSTEPKAAVLAKLNRANHAAVLNLSSGGALNEARGNVGIALFKLIDEHGPPRPETIDKAKRAIDAWIKELEAAKP